MRHFNVEAMGSRLTSVGRVSAAVGLLAGSLCCQYWLLLEDQARGLGCVSAQAALSPQLHLSVFQEFKHSLLILPDNVIMRGQGIPPILTPHPMCAHEKRRSCPSLCKDVGRSRGKPNRERVLGK